MEIFAVDENGRWVTAVEKSMSPARYNSRCNISPVQKELECRRKALDSEAYGIEAHAMKYFPVVVYHRNRKLGRSNYS